MFLLKPILVFLGTISLFAGIAGIFIPGLPTTPFLLLTAGLYIRSSRSQNGWLISNRYFGSCILHYNAHRGMTLRSKFYALAIMSIMITFSCTLLIDRVAAKLVVIALGITGAVVMTFIVPTVKNNSINKN